MLSVFIHFSLIITILLISTGCQTSIADPPAAAPAPVVTAIALVNASIAQCPSGGSM